MRDAGIPIGMRGAGTILAAGRDAGSASTTSSRDAGTAAVSRNDAGTTIAASAAVPDAGMPVTYSEARCATCHGVLTSRKFKHSHLKDGACADCHVPSAGDTGCKGAVGKSGWKLVKNEPELCASCHDKTGDTPLHAPITKLGGCTVCHDAHGENIKKNLKATATALCVKCHGRKDEKQFVHTAMKKNGCTGCHDSHSGVEKPLLKIERVDLCAECHDEKALQGPDHGAAAAGKCLGCHEPHSSDTAKLIRPKTPPPAKPTELVAVAYEQALCSQCHVGITKKQFRHSFFKDGTCSECHVPADKRTGCKQPIKAGWALVLPEPQLCEKCHDKTGDTPMHKVIGMRGCTSCHNAHSSDNKRLLTMPADKLCASCHGTQKKSEHDHTAVRQGKCVGCHEPHSGVTAPLLREAKHELCEGCHAADRLMPLADKHVPVRKGRCLECHGAHGGKNPNALVATGNALCLRCHQSGGVVPAGGTASTKVLDLNKKRVHDPVKNDECGTCHVQGHSSKVSKLLKKPQDKLCAECHDKTGKARLHPVIEQKGCTACHDPHASDNRKLLVAWPQEKLCYSCHEPKNKQASVHSPVAQGECLGCHDAHSGEEEPLLKEVRSELCFECHDKKELSGGVETHTPVSEGRCSECHDPHGGAARMNLRANGKALCLKCHDSKSGTDKSVMPARRIDMGAKVPHKPVRDEDCQSCHQRGHGGPVKKLLKSAPPELCYGCHDRKDDQRFVHGAVKVGDCAVCHDPHGSANKSILRRAKPAEMCFDCHQDDLTGRPHIHKPAGEGKCLECHDPHGEAYPFNIKLGQKKDVCLKCHDKMNVAVKVKHKPLERYGCTACHDAHGGSARFQLIKPVNKLCQSCHETITDGQHATTLVAGGHIISGEQDPRRKDKKFNCASCHNPHGSDQGKLFYVGEGMLMCDGCHGDRMGQNPELVDLTEKKPARDGDPQPLPAPDQPLASSQTPDAGLTVLPPPAVDRGRTSLERADGGSFAVEASRRPTQVPGGPR